MSRPSTSIQVPAKRSLPAPSSSQTPADGRCPAPPAAPAPSIQLKRQRVQARAQHSLKASTSDVTALAEEGKLHGQDSSESRNPSSRPESVEDRREVNIVTIKSGGVDLEVEEHLQPPSPNHDGISEARPAASEPEPPSPSKEADTSPPSFTKGTIQHRPLFRQHLDLQRGLACYHHRDTVEEPSVIDRVITRDNCPASNKSSWKKHGPALLSSRHEADVPPSVMLSVKRMYHHQSRRRDLRLWHSPLAPPRASPHPKTRHLTIVLLFPPFIHLFRRLGRVPQNSRVDRQSKLPHSKRQQLYLLLHKGSSRAQLEDPRRLRLRPRQGNRSSRLLASLDGI